MYGDWQAVLRAGVRSYNVVPRIRGQKECHCLICGVVCVAFCKQLGFRGVEWILGCFSKEAKAEGILLGVMLHFRILKQSRHTPSWTGATAGLRWASAARGTARLDGARGWLAR